MIVLRKEFKGATLSNGKIGSFNTDDITDEMIPYYQNNGFAHIFKEVKEKKTKNVKKTEDKD